MYSPFDGFNLLFGIMPFFFFIIFALVIGIIIVRLVRGAGQWKRNNDSPVLTVDAAAVTKRADVQHYHHSTGQNNMDSMSSSTTYYVTFEVPSGDRMELRVSDYEYGMIVEGDRGKLTFQGTRFLGFERSRG